MKKCPKCQTVCSDENKFCRNCGAELVPLEETPAAPEPVSQEEIPAAPEKKSKLPVILLLCALFVLGIGAGLFVAHLTGNDRSSEPKQESSAKKEEPKQDKKETAGDAKDTHDGQDDQKKEEQDGKTEEPKDEKPAAGENFYQAAWCSFSYPEEWAGKVRIEEKVYQKNRIISISLDEKNEYDAYPMLYAIELSDYPFVEDPPTEGDEFFYNPGYMETISVSTTGVYAHLVQPTDAQFSPDQEQEYMKLFNADLQIIRDTFKFDY